MLHSNQIYTTKFNLNMLNSLPEKFGTPLWVYDAEVIRQQIGLLRSFDVIRFAQKACSNIHILGLMRAENVKIDAVSLGEIQRALAAGYQGGFAQAEIIFTADIVDESTLDCVVKHQIPVNAGSLEMLAQLGTRSTGHAVWLRINPGFGHGHSQKTNTGGENSKHGIWFEELSQALISIKQHQLQLVGLHMHIGSGADYAHLSRVCKAMVRQVKNLGHDIQAISAGGGLSIPYRAGEEAIDVAHYFHLWDQAKTQIEEHLGHNITLEIEPGRFLVAQAGVMITQVRAVKNMGKRHFTIVDAGFNDLMRPVMYGSYHHISCLQALEHTSSQPIRETVIAGPLCESGDVFTQKAEGRIETRWLPELATGDYLVFHDTGAYGASMSSTYNSRPLIPEVLIDNERVQLIRRRQTMDDLLSLEEITSIK